MNPPSISQGDRLVHRETAATQYPKGLQGDLQPSAAAASQLFTDGGSLPSAAPARRPPFAASKLALLNVL
jgi:hypothetical protein